MVRSTFNRGEILSDGQLQLGADDAYLALVDAWEKVVSVLGENINKPSFEAWIRTTQPIGIEGEIVTLGTTSRFGKKWLEDRHLPAIQEILEQKLGCSLTIKVELLEEVETAIIDHVDKLPPKPQKSQPKEASISMPLNSKYNFDSFVVGPNNRLAHACALAVSENPGRTYNPLFVYGGAGLGKTHLMHAMGHNISIINPKMRVLYVSGETFTFHYVNSLRERSNAEFRRRYRNVDLFLVDDVQFLMGKDRTEEEFFHTYNAIYDMGKQIVLTSDRAPKDLELDNRLLSRFECGMVADVKPPDLETRMAILQSKASFEHMLLSDEVILYIARLITSNIRQLEGALIKLHAYASLMRTSVTQTLAEDVLGKYYEQSAAPTIDAQRIQDLVAERLSVDISELKGASRTKDIVAARQMAMYLTRELTDSSLPVIGKAFGGKDHTTVMHSCKKVEEKLSKDKNYASLVEELSCLIKDGKTC